MALKSLNLRLQECKPILNGLLCFLITFHVRVYIKQMHCVEDPDVRSNTGIAKRSICSLRLSNGDQIITGTMNDESRRLVFVGTNLGQRTDGLDISNAGLFQFGI